MSHQIIIRSKSSASAEAGGDHLHGISAEIVYSPDHSLTPEQIGAIVTKILKKFSQMDD